MAIIAIFCAFWCKVECAFVLLCAMAPGSLFIFIFLALQVSSKPSATIKDKEQKTRPCKVKSSPLLIPFLGAMMVFEAPGKGGVQLGCPSPIHPPLPRGMASL